MKKIGLLLFVLLSMVVLTGNGYAQQNGDTVNRGGFDTTFRHGKINLDSLIHVQDSIRHVMDSLNRLKHGNDSLPPNHGGKDTLPPIHRDSLPPIHRDSLPPIRGGGRLDSILHRFDSLIRIRRRNDTLPPHHHLDSLPPNHGGFDSLPIRRDSLPPNHGGRDSISIRGGGRLDSMLMRFDSLIHLRRGGDSLPPRHHLDSLPPNGRLDSLVRRFDSLFHRLHNGDTTGHHGIDTINPGGGKGKDTTINTGGGGKDTTINTGGGGKDTTINTGGGGKDTTINTGGGGKDTTINTGGGGKDTTINTGGGGKDTTINTIGPGLDTIIHHGPPIGPIKTVGGLDSLLHHGGSGKGAIIVPKPIYPNPVFGAVQQVTQEYSLDAEADVSLTISDGSGNIVRQIALGHLSAGAYMTPVNVTGLTQGTYYIRIQAGASTQTQKFVVM